MKVTIDPTSATAIYHIVAINRAEARPTQIELELDDTTSKIIKLKEVEVTKKSQ
jgi:hypothetical protein